MYLNRSVRVCRRSYSTDLPTPPNYYPKPRHWVQWAEEQLEVLQAALAGKLEERAKEAADRLDVLQRRVDTLEEVGCVVL